MAPWARGLRWASRGSWALLLVVLACAAEAQTDSVEYAIKATYLYKFTPFVEWPENAFASPVSPIDLCVVGDDPFGEVLDRAAAGQTAGRRAIAVRRLREVSRNSGCHIAYLAGSTAQSAVEAVAVLRGTPVLTVTDAALTSRARGIVHFVVFENRVRFEVDDRAASENGLVISSKVLSLALSVRPRT